MHEEHTLVPEKSFSHIAITLCVMLATVMQTLDTTIANVSLTHMQGSFSATQDQMIWVLTSYIVASAITIPLSGWLANTIGRKFILLASILGFTIASIFCGSAQNITEMVIFRLLQGIFGAALIPLSQAILLDINTQEKYGRAMGMWGVGVTLGPIIGPVLGGWLTENYSWRWVFYINVPIGILAFSGLYFFLPESKTRKSRFDFFGFITLSLGVGLLQFLLDRGEIKNWTASPEIVIEILLSCLGFYLFIMHTLTYKNPFLNPALFKNRNFVVGNILIFVIGIVLFATLALVPPMLQTLLNYPVYVAGLVTAPRGMGVMLAMFTVGRLMEIIDPRVIIIIGLSITSYSFYLMTQYSLSIDQWSVIYPGLIQGIGIGFSYVPLSAVAFTELTRDLHNEGASLFNLMRSLGSSIGISVMESLLVRNTQIVHASLGEHITPYNAHLNNVYMGTFTGLPSLVRLNNLLTSQANMIAYNDNYKLMMEMTLCVIVLVFLLRAPRKKQELKTNFME